MTAHALQRILERVPGLEPGDVLRMIRAALKDGTLTRAGVTPSGDHVCELTLSTGKTIFPLIANDGAVVTVFTEGMSATLDGKSVLLRRRPLGFGVHRITSEAYHADPMARPSLSSTIARTLTAKSPLHAWTEHPRLNPNWEPTESKTFDFGRAAHRAVLGRGDDFTAYPASMLAKDGAASTKAAKEWAEAERDAGRTPLKQEDYDRVYQMAEVAKKALPEFGIEIDPAYSEVAVLAEIDGVQCRAMIDNAPPKPLVIGRQKHLILVDFKTCLDATPDACVKAVESYGYDLQMGHYLDTWKAATEEDRSFIFAFQEKIAPFEMSVLRLLNEPNHSGDWLEDARDKAHSARALWKSCVDQNRWPGYPRVIMDVGARPFYRQKWQDRKEQGRSARDATAETIRRASQWQQPAAE